MPQIKVVRKISAPIDVVFNTVADIENLANTIPYIVKIEFLSSIKSGVGTRFRETRSMDGRELVTELEVTEYSKNEHIRMVADTHGTTWDSKFSAWSKEEETTLVLTMDATGHGFLKKLMNVLLQRLYRIGLEKHMDEVKKFCEK